MIKKTKIAIIGSGNIGTDLLVKVTRSAYLECTAFIGRRNLFSPGMMKARALNIPVSDEGIQYIENNPCCCEVVFDATSSIAHMKHAPILQKLNKFVIDLTPAKIGKICVPVINLETAILANNVNLVTCGGQTSAPIAHAIGLLHDEIDYLEVVSSIASHSAGRATRLNLDEYIHTTEHALAFFSGAKKTKAILNLNPAQPSINMQTTVFAKVKKPNIEGLKLAVNDVAAKVQKYVPGYEIIVNPMMENDRIVVMVRVKGLGDYLPEYAGNLDIINCAAVSIAEKYSINQKNNSVRDGVNEYHFNE